MHAYGTRRVPAVAIGGERIYKMTDGLLSKYLTYMHIVLNHTLLVLEMVRSRFYYGRYTSII